MDLTEEPIELEPKTPMDLTDAEAQLIYIIRESAASDEDIHITIEKVGGAWETSFSAPVSGAMRTLRGTGADFGSAWSNDFPVDRDYYGLKRADR